MKITKDYLREIIRESINQELQGTEKVNEVSDALLTAGAIGGVIAAIPIIGYGAFKALAKGRDVLEKVREIIDSYQSKKKFDERVAADLEKIAYLTQKHANNEELIQLLDTKQMKAFIEKLGELEQADGGKKIGPGLGKKIYNQSKKQRGL